MVESNQSGGSQGAKVDAPSNVAQASLDDKFRLKLPAEFVTFLDSINGRTVFITTLDNRLGRIYPIWLWQDNLRILENTTDDPEAAESLAYMAKVNGDTATIDGNGRVLLPSALRDALGLAGKEPLWVEAHNNSINIFTKRVHEERMQTAAANAAENLRKLKKLGFK